MTSVVRTLRTHRDLRLLLGAGLVSLSGDWILGVGLAYSIYVLTGSTLASAVTLLCGFVPQVLLSTVAGVFVDRWDRKRTMVTANLLLAVGLLPLLVVHDAGQAWVVYVVLVVESVVELFFAPAEQALIPRLVPDEVLPTANALAGQNNNLARLVGSAVGGLCAAAGGITAVALLDAVTFLVSAALIGLIRTDGHAPRHDEESATHEIGDKFARLRHDWWTGLRAAGAGPVMPVLLAFVLITSIGEGIMGTLFAPFVRSVLHGGGGAYGMVIAVQAIGGVVGGFAVASIGNRLSPVKLLGFGAVLFGLVDLAIFLYPLAVVAVWPAVLGMILVGVPGALVVTGETTLFQRYTLDAQRGRIYSVLMLVQSTAMVVGTVTAGFLGESVGIVPVLACQGAGYVLAGLFVAWRLRGHVVRPQEQPGAEAVPGPVDAPLRQDATG